MCAVKLTRQGVGGAITSANAGMSSEYRSENLRLRKPKVSAPTFVVCGLGDPKVSPMKVGVADGLLVNIPVLGCGHLTWGATQMDKACEKLNFSSKRRSRILLANPRVRLSEA